MQLEVDSIIVARLCRYGVEFLLFIFLVFLALKGEKDCITEQRTEINPLSERPPNITSQPGMKP
jgi:hypothetical protein